MMPQTEIADESSSDPRGPGFRADLKTVSNGFARFFGRAPYLVGVGLFLPWFCVVIDPAVFRSWAISKAWLGDYGTMSYLIIGLSMASLIGVLGVAPFVTATAYLAAALQAKNSAGASFRPALALAVGIFFLGVPLTSQLWILREVDLAHGMLEIESEGALVEEAASRLKRLSIFYDPDSLVRLYGVTENEKKQERLEAAYRQITGASLEVRKSAFDD